MTRTDSLRSPGDSWDLASSVGATATMVAAARALASREPDAIINDPFAAPLVRAVGLDFFTRMLDGEINPPEDYPNAERDLQFETDSMAVRTRFFDDFFVDAAREGVHQSVILAAGLDARAYRLPWPAGSVVFEVDQPKVVEFKTSTMSALGAAAATDRRTVSIDLREDWPAALRRSGFDTTKPTTWSAEGLLMYLPPHAQDRLFDNITELSAPGSRLATEYHSDTSATMAQRAQEFNQRWVNLGCDIDLTGLFYDGERSNVVDYLSERGWRVSTRPRSDMFADFGRDFPDDDGATQFRTLATVTAVRV
jgi:methyltransferase (TIGR00027 family)